MDTDADVGLAPDAGTAASDRLVRPDVRSADARYWLLALASLAFAASAMFGRYLFWDTFYDLYAGRYIVRHGIPRTNVVTVAAAGARWVDQQWLAHVLYYGAWAADGYRPVAAASGVAITVGFVLLAGLMVRRGVPGLRAFEWTAAGFAVCFGSLIIRAESFAFPLFALTLWLLAEDDRSPRPRRATWLLIPLLVVWVNTHGSALLGAGIVGLYAAWRVARAAAGRDGRAAVGYAVLGLAAGASLLCTPYGGAIIADDLSFVGNGVLARNIVEWGPQRLSSPVSWTFFAMTAATAIAVAIAWRRGTRPHPGLGCLTLILFALALVAMRNQVWFGMGASLLAADTLARSGRGRSPAVGRALAKVAVSALGLLALASAVTLAATPDRQFYSEAPVRAIDAAAAIAARHPAVTVLGDEASGSALLWLHPALFGRVGFDWRLDQYSAAQLTSYFAFLQVRGPSWQRVMRAYDIVVVSRTQDPRLSSALAGLAAARPASWRIAYRDQDGLVLARC